MGFAELLGNDRIVVALRGMLARDRVPSAMLFVGPRGIGKFTLARMFAQAANCERLRDDFCGECETCRKISVLANPTPLIEQGLAERGENPDTATVERVPLILETHADVWAIVPDPVRRKNPVARPMIRMGQLRAVQRAAQFKPEHRRKIFILDGAETMRWTDADVFLKILEEPPEYATLILLSERADGLLPTIRSRCIPFWFAPVEQEKIECILEERTEMKAAERKLAAQLAAGSPGTALQLDLEHSRRVRQEILRLLADARAGKSYRAVLTATTRLAKSESETIENVLHVFYSLVADLLEFAHNPKSCTPRNPDLRRELESMAADVTDDWLARATEAMDRLERRLRRNIGRQLGLDALAVAMQQR